jgi:hypothetical protein
MRLISCGQPETCQPAKAPYAAAHTRPCACVKQQHHEEAAASQQASKEVPGKRPGSALEVSGKSQKQHFCKRSFFTGAQLVGADLLMSRGSPRS